MSRLPWQQAIWSFHRRYMTVLISYYCTVRWLFRTTSKTSSTKSETLISGVPKGEKLIIFEDFNARFGAEHQTWEGTIGRSGGGKCNSSGLLLPTTCFKHDLLITKMVFCEANQNWMHLRSKHWHLTDYVVTRQSDRKDVLITVVLNAGLTIDLSSLSSSSTFGLNVNLKVRRHWSTLQCFPQTR